MKNFNFPENSVSSDLPEFSFKSRITILAPREMKRRAVASPRPDAPPVISAVALSFAIGGGIGNIYDRIIHGSVTDFMHIDFGFFETGIFNMADVSIMVGMLLFLVQSYLKKRVEGVQG